MSAADVAALVVGERQARDRGWWDRMADAYWPDSQVDLSWYTGDGPGFVAASRAMSECGDLSVHRLSPPAVQVVRERAWAEVPAVIEIRTDVDGVLADLASCTRIGYRCERRDGAWRILALDCIYERDTITAVLPGETVPLGAGALDRFRPAYAVLAWHLDRRGYTIGADLLGDDRPDERDAHYTRTLDWLRDTEGDL
ncbi:hypothetical protein AD006_30775 (plasmid) [Pseudonocardia sp. EC080610-09]|uniref:nuclear transport factor 2 family protein n=1 Tax=unclassified Pseudonocardia TaxID=2619320 RepID=UPI000705D935|nr:MULTISPECIES: nuclear transport factor 2 family protein [unclassified Pseudonocardia]ALL79591.1 hypothetical protein AD006_30775 [Pseudonocardia sp. EC080610-09]ALL85455.1 hypothetical protein AD017_30465 [Pseudonocardia sp. EC080619-01]